MTPKKPDPIDILVGRNLRNQRVYKGMTQKKLGEHAGVTFQQIQKYENGHNRISASMLYRLSKTLDMPIQSFFSSFSSPDLDIVAEQGEDKNLAKWLRLYGQTTPQMRGHLFELATIIYRSQSLDQAPGEASPH